MATVVDRLIVALELDPSNFDEGKKKTVQDMLDVRNEANKTGKALEHEGKVGAEFFGALTKGALALFGVLVGAGSFTQFIRMNAAASASTGRFADNIGAATKDLSVWQEIVKQSGGVAADADTAFNNLAQTFWDMRVLGDMSFAGDLQALGLTAQDLENPALALKKLSEASDKFERSDYYRRLQRLGIPDSVINTLVKGRDEVNRLTAAQEKLGYVTDEDAKKAQELEKAWADAASGATDFARDLATDLTPTLIGVAGWIKTITEELKPMGERFSNWMNDLAKSAENEQWYKFWTDLLGVQVKEDSPLAGIHKKFGGKTVQDLSTPLNPIGAGAVAGRVGSAEKIFIDAGYTPAQARGIVAGAYAESRLDPKAFNPAGGGRGARGIGQWRGKRLDDFNRVMGKDVLDATADEQYRFMLWEWKNTEKKAGERIKSSRSADAALSTYISDYMRPAAGSETIGDMRRGRNYIRDAEARRPQKPTLLSKPESGANTSAPDWGYGKNGIYAREAAQGTSTINVTGPITINTRATDAQGIARDFVPSLRNPMLANANRGIVP